MIVKPPLDERLKRITTLVLDVDGVLTDGSVIYSDQGAEIRRFHVRDGIALRWWQALGHRSVIISGRSSPIVDRRAAETAVSKVAQGVADKLAVLKEMAAELSFDLSECCAIGDDIPELALVQLCAIGVAVGDGDPELLKVADHITSRPGGRGAVREVIEWILQAQGRWDEIVKRYQPGDKA